MLVKVVLKAAGFNVVSVFGFVIQQVVVCLECQVINPLDVSSVSDYWARFWNGVVIFPRRTSMVWVLLRRLLLRLARSGMLVSGAGLVIGGQYLVLRPPKAEWLMASSLPHLPPQQGCCRA